MTRVSALDRFIAPTPSEPAAVEDADEYTGDGDYRPFGFTRRAIGGETMLELVLRNGDSESFAYTHLYRTSFNPSEGISLYFTDHVAEIFGERLKELYRHLRSHRVTFICEADAPTYKTVSFQSEPVIRSIVIRRIDPRLEIPEVV